MAQSDANLFDGGHLEKTAVKATMHKKCKDEQTFSFLTLSTMIKAIHQSLCAFEGRKRAKQVKRIVERKKRGNVLLNIERHNAIQWILLENSHFSQLNEKSFICNWQVQVLFTIQWGSRPD